MHSNYNRILADHQAAATDAAVMKHFRGATEHKQHAGRLLRSIPRAAWLDFCTPAQYGRRTDCGSWLHAESHYTAEDLLLGRSAHSVNLCRQRLCPLCDFIAARLRARQAVVEASAMLQAAPGSRWLHLTLTMRNCRGSDLDRAVGALLQCWRLLWKQLAESTPALLGFARSLEVTHNKTADTWHPHIHALLHVASDYGTAAGGYLEVGDLRTRWQRLLSANYEAGHALPQIKLLPVLPDSSGGIYKALAEVCKYPIKPTAINCAADLATLWPALHGRRLHAYGGSWARARREDDPTEDLYAAAAYSIVHVYHFAPAADTYQYHDSRIEHHAAEVGRCPGRVL